MAAQAPFHGAGARGCCSRRCREGISTPREGPAVSCGLGWEGPYELWHSLVHYFKGLLLTLLVHSAVPMGRGFSCVLVPFPGGVEPASRVQSLGVHATWFGAWMTSALLPKWPLVIPGASLVSLVQMRPQATVFGKGSTGAFYWVSAGMSEPTLLATELAPDLGFRLGSGPTSALTSAYSLPVLGVLKHRPHCVSTHPKEQSPFASMAIRNATAMKAEPFSLI